MNKISSLSKARGCLLGVAIGDAMGMPVETMRHEQIMAATSGQGITDFVDPMTNREWVKGMTAGSTTDDWQLTRAVANSLLRTSLVFDAADCAEEHVREFDKSLFGWGNTTETAIKAIKEGTRIVGKDSLPPAEPGKGCGNGIIMKIAPIALANWVLLQSNSHLWDVIKLLGSITHPDIRASIAAYPVAVLIKEAMLRPEGIQNFDDAMFIFWEIIEQTKMYEHFAGVTSDRVSEKLEVLQYSCGSAETLRNAVGCGFHANQTAAFTIGTFLRHPQDFRAGVLEAVNAGGDTDTNASVVGALIGANCGMDAIPEEWKSFRPEFNEPLELAWRLCF